MRLNPGITLDQADEVLREAERAWVTAQGGSGGYYRAYTEAVNTTYPRLQWVFAVPDLAQGLRSAAYWHLLAIGDPRQAAGYTSDPDIARGWQGGLRAENGAFSAEINNQVRALERARAELEALKVLAARPGLPIVLDTNLLLHWRRPNEIAWRDVLREQSEPVTQARLVVPLRVVDELDRQQYSEGLKLKERAKSALRYLYGALRDGEFGQPVPVGHDDAVLELWVTTEDRGEDADLAILRCAADLATLHPVTGAAVLTGDLGMRVRAQQMGLKVLNLPDIYRVPRDESPPASG